jgi:spermidine synthase
MPDSARASMLAHRDTHHRAVRLTVLALLFLSGACGLVYEVVWMRMLTLVFGATAFATTTVLASFFAGLALGAFLFGRVADRARHPLLLYAALEAGIGIFAFLMPLLFAGLNEVYPAVYRAFGLSFYPLSLVRFVLSFLVLLVPATMMGGTLPVLARFFVETRESLGWHVGRIYAVNTFGAVVGTMAAGFFLILLLGVNETAYVAGVLNLLIAGAVVIVHRRVRARPAGMAGREEIAPDGAAARRDADDFFSSREARLALWAVGLSGFCALALEVLWTRALVFFLDNSTHAFTTILTAFLLGIALGSILIARFIDSKRRLLLWLGIVEVLVGIFAVLAIPVLNHSTPVVQSMMDLSPTDPALNWKWIGMRFLTTLSIVLVPTLLIGTTVPLVTKIHTRSVEAVGTSLGWVYSVNTVGGVLGSVAAGFLLIPWLGVQKSIVLIGAVNLMLGAGLILLDPRTVLRTRMGAAAASVVLFGALSGFAYGVGTMGMTSYFERVEAADVLFHEEGIGATVKVLQDRDGEKLVSINGFPVAGTPLGLVDAQMPLAHLPLMLSKAERPKVNLVGFGAGGASWGVMRYDVERVDCVELVPAVLDAAVWFPEVNHGVLDLPRYNAILGDGRNYALVTDEKYDVISVDATSPKMAGNGSLYALEFYELVKGNLAEDGIVVQWFPLHLLSDPEVRMTVRTFLAVFPHTSLWLTPLRGHSILVGTSDKLEIDVDGLHADLSRPEIQAELRELNVYDVMDVLSWFAMGEETLHAYVGDGPLNTDNHPYLEFSAAKAYFVGDLYKIQNMQAIHRRRESPLPFLANIGGTEEERTVFLELVQRRYDASQRSLQGDIHLALGNEAEAIGEYEAALALDPGEKNWRNPVWRGHRPPRAR